MNIHRANLADCESERDTAIVIDVLRAYTTSAFAFGQGADAIALVSNIDEAFELKTRFPNALIMGEDRGHMIEGFDFGNSPTHLLKVDLSGKFLIQRTSAGTQGVVRSRARNILATGLTSLSATICLVQRLEPKSITLVQTGVLGDGRGDEDVACADLIEARFKGQPYNLEEIEKRVRNSHDGLLFKHPDHVAFPSADLEAALEVDRFDFAMMVRVENGVHILHQEVC